MTRCSVDIERWNLKKIEIGWNVQPTMDTLHSVLTTENLENALLDSIYCESYNSWYSSSDHIVILSNDHLWPYSNWLTQLQCIYIGGKTSQCPLSNIWIISFCSLLAGEIGNPDTANKFYCPFLCLFDLQWKFVHLVHPYLVSLLYGERRTSSVSGACLWCFLMIYLVWVL